MRRKFPRRVTAVWLSAVAIATLIGATPIGLGDKKPAGKKKPVELKAEQTIGTIAKIPPLSEIPVEGVGLVFGLDNTGSEAPPSTYRNKLLEQMKKARVIDSEKYLNSPTNSLVIVRGKIPPGITTQDVFDVEIELPPGSTTTSLAGGQLMLTELHMVGQTSKGDPLDGQIKAKAYGSVLIGTDARKDDPKVGRILGGGRVKKDEPYLLIIESKQKSVATAALLQSLINNRFNRLRGKEQEGMAKAFNDEYLTLNIPTNYHHNQYRYFQVVENLTVVNLPELLEPRTKRWESELLDPKTAGAAAIRLEGMGRNAIPTLSKGLASPHPQVRYFAAEALAYLGNEEGVDVLADAAANRPEFRAYALAALAAMDQPASSLRLRELMAHPDEKVRYGAFNSLRIVDSSDPFLGKIRVRDDEPMPEDDDPASMEMRIPTHRRRPPPRRADPFDLYVVDCEGPPLVHVAQTRRCEIVIFGKGQKLQTPVVLGAGSVLINASNGDTSLHISRIGTETIDGPDQKVPTQGLQIAEMICVAANLGATYPEILSMLQAADRQKNLPNNGKLVVDALPSALAAYEEAQVAGRDATKSDGEIKKTAGEMPKPEKKSLKDRFFRKSGK